jgi:hypothetical protein
MKILYQNTWHVYDKVVTLFLIGLVKVSALAYWLLFLKLIPRTWLTHRPDDGGSKDPWNAGKLLPDYMALQLTTMRTSNPKTKVDVFGKFSNTFYT